MVNTFVGDITREIIDYIYSQTKKKNNKKKIKYIIDTITDLILQNLQPYLYTILIILIIIILMNCFQFYYYIILLVPTLQKKNLEL